MVFCFPIYVSILIHCLYHFAACELANLSYLIQPSHVYTDKRACFGSATLDHMLIKCKSCHS